MFRLCVECDVTAMIKSLCACPTESECEIDVIILSTAAEIEGPWRTDESVTPKYANHPTVIDDKLAHEIQLKIFTRESVTTFSHHFLRQIRTGTSHDMRNVKSIFTFPLASAKVMKWRKEVEINEWQTDERRSLPPIPFSFWSCFSLQFVVTLMLAVIAQSVRVCLCLCVFPLCSCVLYNKSLNIYELQI